jgi:hypothetical protein
MPRFIGPIRRFRYGSKRYKSNLAAFHRRYYKNTGFPLTLGGGRKLYTGAYARRAESRRFGTY